MPAHITIVTQQPEIVFGVIILPQPAMEATGRHFFPMLATISIDMIDGQHFWSGLPAEGTLTAIFSNNLSFAFVITPLCSGSADV